MKTDVSVNRFAAPILGLLTVGLLTTLDAATEDIRAAPQTHTLFMGADIEVQQSKGFYRVQNVSGGSFVIKVDGKEKTIPMKFNTVNMKVGHSLKLTESSVNVGKLVVDRGYTSGNDPSVKFARELGATAASAMVASTSNTMGVTLKTLSDLRNAPGSDGRPSGSLPHGGPGPVAMDFEAQAAEAQKNYDTAEVMMRSDINSAGFGANKMQGELADEMFDAIEITFEVSSEKQLNSPYAVVTAQFSEFGAKPNEVQNWVYATELDPINSEVRKVRIKQGGFPRGFVLKSHQLHLYNRGQEVATTVAEKRVPLTRDEAFDYVMIDYLHANKGKTVPATLAMGRLSTEVRNSLSTPILYVKVSKDGLPVAAFTDESCSQPINDPAAITALHELRFKPALDKGKAIEGVARIGSS